MGNVSYIRSFLSHRIATHLNTVGVVNQTVEDPSVTVGSPICLILPFEGEAACH